ncbi:hypothetical protein [Cupriavidus consociatus]|uniref:hypothetical protein n=1 Tax=Cupriavidus consociatus TaxID=2821357 RepID=UPI001AEA4720|nr:MULTISPECIES: hypothetical protein [unclassified Cupriavidus]MBP0625199.1 hypothetical protein [Cupriavidus sp. LEh25]MDK2661939.1 hypothetical protein [Cupriavidus sp. LEh21]
MVATAGLEHEQRALRHDTRHLLSITVVTASASSSNSIHGSMSFSIKLQYANFWFIAEFRGKLRGSQDAPQVGLEPPGELAQRLDPAGHGAFVPCFQNRLA